MILTLGDFKSKVYQRDMFTKNVTVNIVDESRVKFKFELQYTTFFQIDYSTLN